jgi:hypothetical protein
MTELPESTDELMRLMERWLQGRTALTDQDDLLPVVQRLFRGSDTLSPLQQIEIYREQYWLRHTANLTEDFEGVQFVLGEERWSEVSHAYLSHPDFCSFALRDLGRALPEYLRAERSAGRLEAERGDWAVDMARLEWAYVDVFDAPDEPELDAERISSISPEQWPQATFRISGALRLLQLDHPVSDLRRAIKKGEADALPDKFSEPAFWVVYRRDRRLWDKQITEPAFRLLEKLAAQEPLIPSCEAVLARLPEASARFEEELFTWFSLWGKLGWIRGVVPGGRDHPAGS